MGPVQVKLPSGRGDKYEAVDFIWRKITDDDHMNIMRAKFEKLEPAEVAELTKIFDDEDVDELTRDSVLPSSHMD